MKRLRYWWFRHRNGVPCKAEIREIVSRTTTFNLRSFTVGLEYGTDPDSTLKSIALRNNCTRERVRQILWKLYRGSL